MKKSAVLAILAAASIAGAPAAFAKEDDAGTEVTKSAKPKKEKKICRSEKMTGSLTRVRRTCMTAEQWEQQAAATKKGLDEMARSAAGGANSSWDPSKAPGTP